MLHESLTLSSVDVGVVAHNWLHNHNENGSARFRHRVKRSKTLSNSMLWKANAHDPRPIKVLGGGILSGFTHYHHRLILNFTGDGKI